MIGALLFSCVNACLARGGAKHRKRCGECVPQENEHDRPGSGLAIAIGTMIDAVPEGLVLGISVAQSMAPAVAVVVGFFLANVPESLSGSAACTSLEGHPDTSFRFGRSVHGHPRCRYPRFRLVCQCFPRGGGYVDAVSGGILVAMAMESMVPEASDKTPLFSGTIAVLGFATITALAVLV
jgi:zinc transporter, ZIP family